MTAALAVLNPAALVALASCEQRIERGLKTFIDVGQALAEIRDSRLYKGTHDTFEDYCRERWGFNDRRASQYIQAADLASTIVGTGLPSPTNEGQARALAAVPAPERAEVWREANERTDGKPTAKVVREIAEERSAPPSRPADPDDAHIVFPVPADPRGTSIREPLRDDRPPTPGPAAAVPVAVAGPDSTSPEPGRHLSAVPDPVGRREEIAAEAERIRMVENARRKAADLVSEVRSMVNQIVAGVLLGEKGLITPGMVADVRALADVLEGRLEAQA